MTGGGDHAPQVQGYPTLARDAVTADTGMSRWWSLTDAYRHDPGLRQKIGIAQASGVRPRDWGRLTFAIRENRSSPDWLLTITLAEPVDAWFGGFKSMDRIDRDQASARNAAVEKRGGSRHRANIGRMAGLS